MSRKNKIVLWVTALVFASTLHETTFASDKILRFVEIMPNPDGTDSKTNEYFKISNDSDTVQNLSNFKVCNINNECSPLKGELAPSSCLKVFRSDFVFSLHNDKEEVSLFDSNNNLIDKIVTGSALSGKSLLCGNNFCDWGDPRESCDYSDIIDPSSLPDENIQETEEIPSSEYPEAIDSSDLSDDSNKNSNTNNNSNQSDPFITTIKTQDDWKNVKKIMQQKNLLTQTVNLEGIILVPYNIAKSNSFYLLSAEKLVQVSVYSSKQPQLQNMPLLFQTGTQLEITNGSLKSNFGSWILGVGKETEIKINKNSKHKKAKSLKVSEATSNNEGSSVTLSGRIIKKSGQYFYLEDQKNKKIYSIFIPDIVWQRFVVAKKLGVFPTYTNGKIISATDYKGKNMEITGIIEKSGGNFRILVSDKDNIDIIEDEADNSKPENNQEENSNKNNNVNKNADTPKEKNTNHNLNNNIAIERQAETESNPTFSISSMDKLKLILSQKLSWGTYWNIFAAKIKTNITQLF